jgi:hypothetical protein
MIGLIGLTHSPWCNFLEQLFLYFRRRIFKTVFLAKYSNFVFRIVRLVHVLYMQR